jgi:cytidylate kinase
VIGTKIVVAGLTAAGKTTHSQLIASAFSVPYFSGSALLSELADMPGPWKPDIDVLRSQGDLDLELDRMMVRKFESSAEGIFDTWALPWLSSSDAVRVWIESDMDSRVRKAAVTELRRGLRPNMSDVRKVVESKDSFSRELFTRLYDFDLYDDHEVFDIVIDNSSFIPRATIEASDRGIREFNRLMLDYLRDYAADVS